MAATVTAKVRESGLAVRNRGVVLLDRYVPPLQRQELSDGFKEWTRNSPRLSAFVLAQLCFSGPPLVLFFAFTVTVLTASVLACTLTALALALAFTALCAGTALLVLLPTLFVATMSATFLFAMGVVGSAAMTKFSNDPRTENIRSRARTNATVVGERVKDASNGSIDLNAAAQHLGNKVNSALSPSTPRADENAASEEQARQNLARQALGVPKEDDELLRSNPSPRDPRSVVDGAPSGPSGRYQLSDAEIQASEQRLVSERGTGMEAYPREAQAVS